MPTFVEVWRDIRDAEGCSVREAKRRASEYLVQEAALLNPSILTYADETGEEATDNALADFYERGGAIDSPAYA